MEFSDCHDEECLIFVFHFHFFPVLSLNWINHFCFECLGEFFLAFPPLTAAARALMDIPELSAEDVARKAMQVAGDMCIYTNHEFRSEIVTCAVVEEEEEEDGGEEKKKKTTKKAPKKKTKEESKE